jgi:hypothetical protein
LFLSITRRLRDRDTIRREVIAWILRVHDGARRGGRSGRSDGRGEPVGRIRLTTDGG